MPPGELDAKVEAEPPRTDSTRATLKSVRRKMSALPKVMSPNSSTGRPSSCNCRNLDPPDATGRPRTEMLALPSPPDASTRMPGRLRRISAVERGASWTSESALIALVVIDVFNRLVPRATPVTTMSADSSGVVVGSVAV